MSVKINKKILLVVGICAFIFALILPLSQLSQNINNNVTKTIQNSIANPNFTIQSYFYFEKITTMDTRKDIDSGIRVIDTDNGGQNKGGKIPTNGNEKISYVGVEKAGTGNDAEYKLTTHRTLTKMFEDEETNYKENPDISYMDRLYNSSSDYNKNYTLTQVWILKDGHDRDSVDASDFYVYNVPQTTGGRHNPEAINFTNNPNNPNITTFSGDSVPSADKYTILIEEGTVVRLVFDTLETQDYNKAGVKFFDYDLTDGYIYTQATHSETYRRNTSEQQTNTKGPWYTYTNQSGINSSTNYSGTGVKYAFGNSSSTSGSGLGDNQWKDSSGKTNYINRANGSVNTSQAVYGLVSGINADGTVKFTDGISVPDIFGSGTSIGKTVYDQDEFSLIFKRKGGTFTLSGLNRGSERVHTDYDIFTLRVFSSTNHIFSNDFWPMDYAPSWGADGHDLVFGSTDYQAKILNNSSRSMPPSDCGHNHNAYYGMTFESEFTLEPGYVAPLDFFFFGDDDLWVFLTDPNGKTKLIADIGGVHSSLGEYVNLWDYIEPIPYKTDGVENKNSGTYKLNFFYTERGASGSTNYMRFTIPLDTNIAEANYTKELRVEKEVVGLSDDDHSKYNFKVDLYRDADTPFQDLYDYNIYNKDNTLAKTGIMETGDAFDLENGQYLVIDGLPDSTKYTITENTKATKTTYKVGKINGGLSSLSNEGTEFSGSITTNDYVKFTNSYANLKISKKVVSKNVDNDKQFTFKITLDSSINGKYGDMEFENGVTTITLKNNESKQAIGLPENTHYKVEEIDNDDYKVLATNQEGNTIIEQTIDVKFVNYLTKNLKIEKEVVGETNADNYEFTLVLNDNDIENIPKTYNYKKYNHDDHVIDNKTITSNETFNLSNGEYIIIEDLPDTTTYQITEKEAHASSTDYQIGTIEDGLATDKTKGLTVNGEVISNDYVKFINTYANLKISKKVISKNIDNDKQFTFKITLDNKINGKYGDLTFTNGEANFTLKNNEIKYAFGLPDNLSYTVVEEDNEGFNVSKSNDRGILKLGQTINVSFVNFVTNDFIIEKEVRGLAPKDDVDYQFTITLKDEDGNTYNGVHQYKKYNHSDSENVISSGEIKSGDKFALKDDEYIIIESIPSVLEFNIKEDSSKASKVYYYTDNLKSKTSQEIEGKEVSDLIENANYVKFINSYATLEISKTVIGLGDTNKKFSFILTLSDRSINGEYGDLLFINGVALFELKHGQSKKALGLPNGVNYKIEELVPNDWQAIKNTIEGTTKDGETAKAEFINYRTMNLRIEKKVKGIEPYRNKDYKFVIKFSNIEDDGYPKEYAYVKYDIDNKVISENKTIKSGDEFSLKNGEHIVIKNLPDATFYTLEEIKEENVYEEVSFILGESPATNANEVNTSITESNYVGFINSFASLTINKKVTGKKKNANEKFEFTIKLSDETINGLFGDVEFKDGMASFTLKDGQKVQVLGLPNDISYTVTEVSNRNYKVTKTNDTGQTVAGENIEVTFVNKKVTSDTVPGTFDGISIYVVMLLISIICFSVGGYLYRKLYKN